MPATQCQIGRHAVVVLGRVGDVLSKAGVTTAPQHDDGGHAREPARDLPLAAFEGVALHRERQARQPGEQPVRHLSLLLTQVATAPSPSAPSYSPPAPAPVGSAVATPRRPRVGSAVAAPRPGPEPTTTAAVTTSRRPRVDGAVDAPCQSRRRYPAAPSGRWGHGWLWDLRPQFASSDLRPQIHERVTETPGGPAGRLGPSVSREAWGAETRPVWLRRRRPLHGLEAPRTIVPRRTRRRLLRV